MTMRRKLALLLAAAAALPACLAGQECTEIGCSPFGLTLQVVDASQRAISAFDATVTIDGVDYACGGSAGTLQCFGNTVGVNGAPASVRVVVTEKDGARRFEETLEPEYEVSYPNGPECSPECRQATVKAVLR